MYGQGPYLAAKHTVIGLTRSAAPEYGGRGVRINAGCPGTTRTPAVDRWFREMPEQAREVESRIPLNWIGSAEDQARAALWRCGGRSARVTGMVLPVDGGGLLT